MPHDSYYDTAKHLRWRDKVLRLDKYLCQMCIRYGKRTAASHAHHILPRSMHPEHQTKIENGIALCAACHNAIEPRDGEYRPPEWMLRRVERLTRR